MKKVVDILICVALEIKKKFFNKEKSDICHDCIEVLNFNDSAVSQEEINSLNEYIENYKSTTRWQTL